MKIELTRNTIVDGQPAAIGQVIEVDQRTAIALIQMGKAKAVKLAPEIPEQAMPTAETTEVVTMDRRRKGG